MFEGVHWGLGRGLMADSFYLQGVINLAVSENKLCIDLMTERVSWVPGCARTQLQAQSPSNVPQHVIDTGVGLRRVGKRVGKIASRIAHLTFWICCVQRCSLDGRWRAGCQGCLGSMCRVEAVLKHFPVSYLFV